MSVIRRLGLSRNNGIQVGLASTYIGGLDDIWADDINFNLLRRGDGTTPGGIVMGGSGGDGGNAQSLDGQDGTWYLDWTNTTNKPTIATDVNQLTDSSSLLAHATPFSGVYADLTNKPTIATDVSDLTDTGSLLVHVTPFSGVYADLTSKPTTVSGYGITDAFDGSYESLTDTPILFNGSFDGLWEHPSTVAGYGITDIFAGAVTFNGAYTFPTTDGTAMQLLVSDGNGNLNWTTTGATFDGVYSSLTSKPTTLAGYGITDSFSGSYTDLTGKPNFTEDSAHPFNMGIGLDSLVNIPSWQPGIYNTGVGINSLKSATTGEKNTGLGYNSLKATTSGNENTAVGANSLWRNINGWKNVAVGGQTLRENINGENNTAVGQMAMFLNEAGSHNVAIGKETLGWNTHGNYNTAVGTQAWGSSALGEENTVVGYQAGANSTSGTGNVFLGHKAGYSESNPSNQLIIANNETTSIIKGDFGTGAVTFNDVYTFPVVDGTVNQILKTDGVGNLSWITPSSGGGSGGGDFSGAYDDLTNKPNLTTPTFDSITTSNFTVNGSGNVIFSAVDLTFDVTNRAKVNGGPFRLARMTTTEINAVASPVGGDMVFNITTSKFQGYDGTIWADLNV
jgi:hypothetical protein